MSSTTLESRLTPAAKPSWRRALRTVHLWLGVGLSIPLVLLGLTGSILVFQHDIDTVSQPELHKVELGQLQPASKIIDAAKAGAPQGSAASMLALPAAAGDSALVRMNQAQRRDGPPAGPGRGVQVYVDPVSLKVLGTVTPNNGFMRQVHNLHGSMLIPGRDGRSVVGWLGVVMLGMGVSGLVLWWPRGPRWRAAFTVDRNAKGARFNRELHGAVGIWGLVVFIAVSFSGVYLGFPQTVGAMLGAASPPPAEHAASTGQPAGIDEAVAIAQASVAGYSLRTIFLPARPDQPYRLAFAAPGALDGAPLTTVTVDAALRHVQDVRGPGAGGLGNWLVAWQRPLHTGAGLTVVWKLLVFGVGFLPLLFAVTGISMWLLKRAARARAMRAQSQSQSQPSDMMAAE